MADRLGSDTVSIGDTVCVRRDLCCEASGRTGYVEYVAEDGLGLLFTGEDLPPEVLAGHFTWDELEPSVCHRS